MRTRERLLEVLPTVNPEVNYRAAFLLRGVAPLIETGEKPSKNIEYGLIQLLADDSPYIVQLAAEALFYSGLDEEGVAIRLSAASAVMEETQG